MKTLRQFVSDIRGAFKRHSDDVDFSDRFIASELIKLNLVLVNQSLNKRVGWNSPNLFTTLPCIPMEEVPLAECCNIVTDCKVARSKEKLPSIADSKFAQVIQGVWSIDKRTKYKETSPDRYSNYLDLPNKNKNEKFFWTLNDYLYVSDPNLEVVSLSAFFTEPVDAAQYSCNPDDKVCPTNPLDLEFKTLPFIENTITTMMYKQLLETSLRAKPDAFPSREEEFSS